MIYQPDLHTLSLISVIFDEQIVSSGGSHTGTSHVLAEGSLTVGLK